MSIPIVEKSPYTGVREEVKILIQQKGVNIEPVKKMLSDYETLVEESVELEARGEALPKEIDSILASGKMDDKTVERLAKKRTLLDLLPSRLEKIDQQLKSIKENADESILNPVVKAVSMAASEYCKLQLQTASKDLQQLGDVTPQIADEQAKLRPDLKTITNGNAVHVCRYEYSFPLRIRTIIWVFEALQAGLHPSSPDAQKFKNKWNPQG